MMDNPQENQDSIRELAPGVILYKEYKQTSNAEEQGIFVWKVEIATMSTVDFVIDLEESENIKLVNVNGLQTSVKILPFEKKELAQIILKPNWKLKSKFKLTMNVPDKAIQEKFIVNDEREISQLILKCQSQLKNTPFEFLSQTQIEAKLREKSINKFIDCDFIPDDDAIINPRYGENMKEVFDYVIHWRRPENFVLLQASQSNPDIKIFHNQDPEPNDIMQGILPDHHLASALSGIAEKYNLVQRLFKTKDISPYGVYQVTLCIAGQWKTMTIDDLFPCIPMTNPMVTRSPSNELWVLLLEKAIAKVLDCYYSIVYVNITDFLLMLTGCPTFYLIIEEMLRNDETKKAFINKLKEYVVDKKYLTIAMSKIIEQEQEDETNSSLTLGNFGYTVLDLKSKGKNTFIYLRKVWFDQKKEEDIQAYEEKLFTQHPSLKNDLTEGMLILELEDFIREFEALSICYTSNWEEVRIRGKFIQAKENDKSQYEQCLSQWYYLCKLENSSRLIISLFQDEDKFKDSESRKQIMDISLSVFNYDSLTNEISHIQTLDFAHTPGLQQELMLPKGNYLVIPRSSGCFMGKPLEFKTNRTLTLYDKGKKEFNPIFTNIVRDIFKKFDLQMNNKLTYTEFKGFCECTTKSSLEKNEFNTKIISLYEHHESGITEKGFIQYWKDVYLSSGESTIKKWFEALGYDDNLHCNQSRCFQLTFHCDNSIAVSALDTINSDIYSKINRVLIKNFGKLKESKKQKDIIPIIYQSKLNNVMTLGCLNKNIKAQKVKITFTDISSIILGTQSTLEKTIGGNETEVFCHFFSLDPEKINNLDFTIEATFVSK